MSGPLTWKERSRDDMWKAARDRVALATPCRPIQDYWVIDELHVEALQEAKDRAFARIDWRGMVR